MCISYQFLLLLLVIIFNLYLINFCFYFFFFFFFFFFFLLLFLVSFYSPSRLANVYFHPLSLTTTSFLLPCILWAILDFNPFYQSAWPFLPPVVHTGLITVPFTYNSIQLPSVPSVIDASMYNQTTPAGFRAVFFTFYLCLYVCLSRVLLWEHDTGGYFFMFRIYLFIFIFYSASREWYIYIYIYIYMFLFFYYSLDWVWW